MNDILLNILVLGVAIVVVVAIFQMVKGRSKAIEEQLRLLAAREGWTYEAIHERLVNGFRMHTGKWQLEALAQSTDREVGSGSSEISLETRWEADLPGPVVLIGGRTSSPNLGKAGQFLVQQVLRLALGNDADGLNEVQVGGSSLLKRYMVWARNPRDAEILLSPAVLSLLLNWKGREPVITRAANRLVIRIWGQRLNKPGEVLLLVRLGEALLAAGEDREGG